MILWGDNRQTLSDVESESVDCCVTSPPYYGLRTYSNSAYEIGREETTDAYITALCDVFSHVRRVLKSTGTCWLNLGDSYKDKQLLAVPWRVALALQANGWLLRADIIWHKSRVLPESVQDRPPRDHEYVFLLTKSKDYYYNASAIAEPCKWAGIVKDYTGEQKANQQNQTNAIREKKYTVGETRSQRTVWKLAPSQRNHDMHVAIMSEALVKRCLLAGCPTGGLVLDPFLGSGTTAAVAQELGLRWVGCELNRDYESSIIDATRQLGLLF